MKEDKDRMLTINKAALSELQSNKESKEEGRTTKEKELVETFFLFQIDNNTYFTLTI